MILYQGEKVMEFFTGPDFSKSQMEIEIIAKVIPLKEEGFALNTSGKSKDLKEVRMLL